MVKIAEDAAKMHAEAVVLPMTVMTTMDEVKKVAEACNEMARVAKEHGMKFYYHNHCQEFYMVEGKTAYDWLVELTDPELVGFEVDTFWAKRGGQDPCALIRKLGPRAGLIHQKDMGTSASPVDLVAGVTGMTRDNFRDKIFARTNPTDICVVGTGTMEIQEIVETVTELGYASTIVVELDCCARETEEKFDTPALAARQHQGQPRIPGNGDQPVIASKNYKSRALLPFGEARGFLSWKKGYQSSAASGWLRSRRDLHRITIDKTAAKTEVPVRFNQIPVYTYIYCQRTTIRMSGKIRAVETKIIDAGSGFSIASI